MHKNQLKDPQETSTQKSELRQAVADVINNLGVKNDCKGYNYLLTAAVDMLESKTTT